MSGNNPDCSSENYPDGCGVCGFCRPGLPKRFCESECNGYRCTLPHGHIGFHSQDRGSPTGASWPSDNPFDHCKCSGRGTCHVCRLTKEIVALKARCLAAEARLEALSGDYLNVLDKLSEDEAENAELRAANQIAVGFIQDFVRRYIDCSFDGDLLRAKAVLQKLAAVSETNTRPKTAPRGSPNDDSD